MDVWGAEGPLSHQKNVAFSTSKSPLKTAATFHQGSCCWTSVSPRHLHSPKICQPRLWVSPWDATFFLGCLPGRPWKRRFLFLGEPIIVRFHVGFMLEQPTLQLISSTHSWAILNEMDLPQRIFASSFSQGTTTCSMGHLQSPPQKCVLGIRGKQTHKWTWSKPF